MRQRRIRTQDAGRRTAKLEPMAEGIVKKERRPDGFFTKMSDEELVEYAESVMKEKKINGKGELQKADSGLYTTLRRRGLLVKVGFARKRRDWESMSDGNLVIYARRFMEEKSIRARGELAKTDRGLYIALSRRGLLSKIEFRRKLREERDWKSIGDNNLVKYVKAFMKEKRIKFKSELENADKGLYEVFRKRGLLDKVWLDKRHKRRDWKSMDNAKLIEHAQEFIKEKGIRGRTEMEKTDAGLYAVLRLRDLLNSVFSDIEKTRQQSLERELLSGLRLAPEAMEKFGEGK